MSRWEVCPPPPPPRGPGMEPLSGGFSAARRGTIKCNLTAAPQAGKERFFYIFQINIFSFDKFYFDFQYCSIISQIIKKYVFNSIYYLQYFLVFFQHVIHHLESVILNFVNLTINSESATPQTLISSIPVCTGTCVVLATSTRRP